jgi:hypothetical protein
MLLSFHSLPYKAAMTPTTASSPAIGVATAAPPVLLVVPGAAEPPDAGLVVVTVLVTAGTMVVKLETIVLPAELVPVTTTTVALTVGVDTLAPADPDPVAEPVAVAEADPDPPAAPPATAPPAEPVGRKLPMAAVRAVNSVE